MSRPTLLTSEINPEDLKPTGIQWCTLNPIEPIHGVVALDSISALWNFTRKDLPHAENLNTELTNVVALQSSSQPEIGTVYQEFYWSKPVLKMIHRDRGFNSSGGLIWHPPTTLPAGFKVLSTATPLSHGIYEWIMDKAKIKGPAQKMTREEYYNYTHNFFFKHLSYLTPEMIPLVVVEGPGITEISIAHTTFRIPPAALCRHIATVDATVYWDIYPEFLKDLKNKVTLPCEIWGLDPTKLEAALKEKTVKVVSVAARSGMKMRARESKTKQYHSLPSWKESVYEKLPFFKKDLPEFIFDVEITLGMPSGLENRLFHFSNLNRDYGHLFDIVGPDDQLATTKRDEFKVSFMEIDSSHYAHWDYELDTAGWFAFRYRE